MIRLSWLQFRKQAAVVIGLLAAVAVLFGVTGPHLAHLYDVFANAQASCASNGPCRDVTVNIGRLDDRLRLIGTALVAVPALLGAFWGAPLVARELETGTHRLAWTQSVTRTRWLASKLLVVGVGSVAATGLLSLMVTWWSSPIDAADSNRFSSGLFGMRNVVPLGYAAFAFTLGVVAGLVIRRTLPAMAATLFAFLSVRLAFTYWVRPHLLPPAHLSLALDPTKIGFGSINSGPMTLQPADPSLPGAWIYSSRLVDRSGHGLTAQYVADHCSALTRAFQTRPRPPQGSGDITRLRAPQGTDNALASCVRKVGATFHEYVTYQPAGRYWPMQWLETGAFVVAALALAGLCFWLLRRRLA